MAQKRIMTIYGTRPEAIKVAPIIKALEESDSFESLPVVTGQHKEMLAQVNDLFGIEPVRDLQVMTANQTLNGIVSKVVQGVDGVLEEFAPDAVIVQGDTSTVMGAAIAAFNREIPVIHLEAGLRSGDINSPFPEEANRKLTTQITKLHLAPTEESKGNLLRENVPAEDIVVTGNSVIDALFATVEKQVSFSDQQLEEFVGTEHPVVLVTTHRRENLGEKMVGISRAIRRLALEHPEYRFVFPMHKNPKVRSAVLPQLEDLENVLTIEPLDYGEFTRLIGASRFVLTDSGGVQEEAPSLGKPVLVLRENTERPEAVTAGTVRLIGTDVERIVEEATALIEDEAHFASMANAVNPYGDGRASSRTEAALRSLFGEGERLPDFTA
ncbi:UDP-N-acetylglucosamine 2-epimerase (non-hydrolyzing) [Rothia sp. AR01]|uniref:UDP-N-acetylglucosamine 2-epimerase (non-hydrolyzing) n=1 Tax=Rothia santali TaxID=2949643 RepID=A0A9X2HAR4_9MICC|nr:UDP-N-acetylglucosamine 2-epimerase (non-hydrolyzing) [Rothia santali]MCP3426194.1 UDP-N-acetylglucosamine 2-epimerase (non-hydrolyzing) [Rothia santali]